MAADDFDPPALLSPLRAGLKLVRVLQRWNEGPERASIYQDHYEEWVADLAARLRENVARDIELAERLDALEQDRERVLVLGNLGFEAWREAVDRRRAMLGDAALAAIFSELSAAELARVERTIRMLDPEDLDLLIELTQLKEPMPATACFVHLRKGHLEGAALEASGCVRVFDGSKPDYDDEAAEITAIGRLVLRFMGRSS